jgi:short-subunit dehydrogenase
MSGLRPVTVITGASAGIGVALARVFAQHGHELALIARREDRLHALADEIAATGARRPMVIAADLLKAGAARLIGEALATQGAQPQFFVNNSGFGLVGLARARDRDEQLEMIDLNVRALTELSFAFVDSLARHRGGLLNVGSMAGFSARSGHGGLLRHQGVRTVVHGSIAIASSNPSAYESQCCVRARCRPNSPSASVSVMDVWGRVS